MDFYAKHPILYRCVPIAAGAALVVGGFNAANHTAGAAHADIYNGVSAVYKYGGGGTAPMPMYASTASTGVF